tara:strand:- start:123 stop:893 length:771 start_codon:yes stop_codon:yes gene_type:complete
MADEAVGTETAFKPFEAEIKLFQIVDFMLCQTTLPMVMVDALNDELDRLRADKDRGSHSHTLVGQIKKGEQLALPRENPVFGKVYTLVEQLAMTYVDSFGKLTSLTGEIPWVGAQCKDLWSVHMFSGDYNPMHDHGSDTEAGMSFVFWTRVPENMRNAEVDNLFDSSGYLDGCIKFFNGPFAQRGPMQFRPPKVLDIVPEPGKFVIFPHWLNHTVYPFTADGERTTISGNVNLFSKTPEEMEKEQAGDDKAPEAVS